MRLHSDSDVTNERYPSFSYLYEYFEIIITTAIRESRSFAEPRAGMTESVYAWRSIWEACGRRENAGHSTLCVSEGFGSDFFGL